MNPERTTVPPATSVQKEVPIIPGVLSLINGECPVEASGFLVKTQKGVVLVDPGSGKRTRQIEKILDDAGAHHHKTVILTTHKHMDHIDGAGRLEEHGYAGEVWAVKPNITVDPTGDVTAADLYGERFPGVHIDREVVDGEVLRFGDVRFYVVTTPGHAPDHACYIMHYHGLSVAMIGDIDGGLSPRLGGDLEQQVSSIQKLLRLPFDYVLEGHGSVTQPLRPRVEFEKRVRRFGYRLRKGFGYLEDPVDRG